MAKEIVRVPGMSDAIEAAKANGFVSGLPPLEAALEAAGSSLDEAIRSQPSPSHRFAMGPSLSRERERGMVARFPLTRWRPTAPHEVACDVGVRR